MRSAPSKALLLATLSTLGACAFDPQTASTDALCKVYSAPLMNGAEKAAAKGELLRRGADDCVDPALAGARSRNALATGLLGPLGGLAHSAVEPAPHRAEARREAADAEIADVRRQQATARRREAISTMVAQGASDAEIRKALLSADTAAR